MAIAVTFDAVAAQAAVREAGAMVGRCYLHYEGYHYQVRDVAADASAGYVRVTYVSIDPGPKQGGKWSRPLSEWSTFVKWPDGITRPRYILAERKTF